MFNLKRLIGSSLFVFVLAATALAQESRAPIDTLREPVPAATAGPMVIASATAKRVRFVSPGTVVQLRLEVYNEAGQKLFDTELHGGNVLDWYLQDGAGERLPASSYATVLTIKSLSGRLTQRVGLVTVNDKKAAIVATGASELSMAQQQTIGPVEGNSSFTILQQSEAEAITAVTHDGTQGQLTSTTGALTFRTGDVFAGKDKEQMRITEDGRVGVGTDKPEATLDVAGTVRVSEGLRFSDGTTLSAAAGKFSVLNAKGDPVLDSFATGTGTQNQVAKWTETGGAGTLGDSTITEVGGKVGIGITNPTYKLVVGPDIGPGLTTSDLTISRGPGQSVSIYAGASGSNGMNFGWDQGNLRAFVNAPVQSPITFTHGGVSERMRIATDGNVGIGTNNPTHKLSVNGSINAMSEYYIGGARMLSAPGTNNMFVGAGAGNVNSGNSNSFFGQSAGLVNGAGFANSFFGAFAGSKNIGGSGNSMFGAEAGFSNDSGARNAFFGRSAGRATVSGNDNTFVGYGAGDISTSSDNTFVGSDSGGATTLGSGNTFLGSNAGVANTEGINNTFIGRSAGNTNATGSANTVIGYGANLGSSGLIFATAVGANAVVSQSNSLVLGNNANVGIGTSSPDFKLHVVGGSDAEPGSGGFIVAGQTNSTNIVIDNNEIMARNNGAAATLALNGDGGDVNLIQSGTGSVGIGTNNPGAKLDVDGIARADSLEVNGGAIRVIGAGVGTNTAAFIHVNAGDGSDDNTQINHPLCNNRPDALLFVTSRWPPMSSTPTPTDITVFYSSGRWYIHSETDIYPGHQFNVLVILP